MKMKEKTLFKIVADRFDRFRTLQLTAEVGSKKFVFIITTPSCSADKNAEILEKLQDIAEAEFGDRMYAFQTAIHCGTGHDWRKKSGAKVMVIIPPEHYNPDKRKQGLSGTWTNLLDWIQEYTIKVTKKRT